MKVPQHEVQRRIARFKEKSRGRGLPITPQKEAIFRALAGTYSHPTAQQLYDKVQLDFPSMSLATVYKNLNGFVALGLAQEISSADGASHFDANAESHVHVVDLTTGKMADANLKSPLPLPEGVGMDRIERISVVYYLR